MADPTGACRWGKMLACSVDAEFIIIEAVKRA
jgi:hypothetical protein